MIYLEQPPPPALQPWVRSLWYCRAPKLPHSRERVLPNGSMQIIINLSRPHLTDCGEDGLVTRPLPRAIVVGARSRFEVIDTTDLEELVGVAFHPGGFARLFRERADLFFEQSVGLEDLSLSGRDALTGRNAHSGRPTPKSLAEASESVFEGSTAPAKLGLLGSWLQRLAPENIRRSQLVDQAIDLFRSRSLSVSECARSIGVSERRLSQVFREEVGLSPKMWCRIGRFQAAVRALHRGVDVRWAELALSCGYYDQPHFANDFRAFSGIDPTTYSAHRGRWQNHVPISPG